MTSRIHSTPVGGLALVSGATGAIGSAVSARLADRGLSVVMLGRDERRLARARDVLAAASTAPDRIHTAVIDIGADAGFEAAFDRILVRFPHPTLLVHAAGGGPMADLAESTEAQWQEGLQGKLMGAVRLARATCRAMTRRTTGGAGGAGGGQLIFMNGVFAKEPDPLFPINSTVNCAMLGFAKAISRDVARQGVRVNVINPGPVDSPLWQDTLVALARRAEAPVDQVARAVLDRIPVGRLASPDDVANAVEWLLHPGSAYLNGAVIDVDGGLTAAL